MLFPLLKMDMHHFGVSRSPDGTSENRRLPGDSESDVSLPFGFLVQGIGPFPVGIGHRGPGSGPKLLLWTQYFPWDIPFSSSWWSSIRPSGWIFHSPGSCFYLRSGLCSPGSFSLHFSLFWLSVWRQGRQGGVRSGLLLLVISRPR